MVNVLVNAKRTEQVRVYLDVEQYRGRRQQALQQLAQKVADRVATTGRAITLEPMTAAERRVIHLTLANHPSVSTYSVDAGLARKVTVAPKRAGSQPRHGGSNDGKNNAT
jgi:spoIIIJ-associated protein